MGVHIRDLDMRRADDYTLTEFDIVRRDLQSIKKYCKDLLYRGFNGKNIPLLLETGQDTRLKVLWCATEDVITDPYPTTEPEVFEIARENDIPALVVFDSRRLYKGEPFAYAFRNPKNKLEALVAVYRLIY